MKTLRDIDELRALRDAWRRAGERVGFVPTMGALHRGHLSLVEAARARCDRVLVSIFVNPTQFGPNEDLERYPRDLPGDLAKLAAAGADAAFTPSSALIYPPGACTWVTVEGLTEGLCGARRPGHFRGVTTVVSQLFHLVEPDDAFFGEKDRQQLVVIRRMARDLHFRTRIHGCPIVRESDGLALSSRNAYLSTEERARALALSRALRRAREAWAEGERDAAVLCSLARAALSETRIDYVELVDPETLQPVARAAEGCILAVAAFVGETRLIDNHVLSEPFPA